MPELIERHALLKKMYEHPQERERMTDGEWCRKCIYEAPTIEAEPVRHGRWIQRRNGEYHCTNCGREEKFIFQKNYCPRCGVRMDATDTNVGGKGGDDNAE